MKDILIKTFGTSLVIVIICAIVIFGAQKAKKVKAALDVTRSQICSIKNLVSKENIAIEGTKIEYDLDNDGIVDVSSIYVWNEITNQLIKISEERIE